MTRLPLALALLAAACGGHSTHDVPASECTPHEVHTGRCDAWTQTPLDPVREAWGSRDGVLTPPPSSDAEWCGLVAVPSISERLAPVGASSLDVEAYGVSCVVLAPGESVAFYARQGGVNWLARQEHARVTADGSCPLRCEP